MPSPPITLMSLLALQASVASPTAAPAVGDVAPALKPEARLNTSDGSTATWEALRGKVVVLELWATWCAPCVAAIPHLNELTEHYRGKPVQFISITDERREAVERFLNKRAIKGWVGLDTDRELHQALAIRAIPETFVIDRAGRITARVDPALLSAEILDAALVEKPLPAVARPDRSTPTTTRVPGEGPEPLFELTIAPSAAEYSAADAEIRSRLGIVLTAARHPVAMTVIRQQAN